MSIDDLIINKYDIFHFAHSLSDVEQTETILSFLKELRQKIVDNTITDKHIDTFVAFFSSLNDEKKFFLWRHLGDDAGKFKENFLLLKRVHRHIVHDVIRIAKGFPTQTYQNDCQPLNATQCTGNDKRV